MAYYTKKKKTDLAKIGEEMFAVIDDIFPAGGRTQQQVFHHQYHPQQAYVVQQQPYEPPKIMTEMAYYSKKKTDLAKIGEEMFAVIDDIFPAGGRRNSKPPSAPPQYHPQQPYEPPMPAKIMTERVPINCNEAAKLYGGTLVDYPKKKPARKSFFF